MTARVHFHREGAKRVRARVPFDAAAYVLVPGLCPSCGHKVAEADVPRDAREQRDWWPCAGLKGSMVRGHDTYTSLAGCTACGKLAGKLVVTVSTIFGIEEDERVLNGRARVY